jgi:DNA-binding transcriptional MerR regulator
MKKEWTLRELAAGTGVPERTIRFYISRGLVDPPLKAGRGAAYGAGHKARLEGIKKLQAKGLMLGEIAHAIALASSEPVLPAPALGLPALPEPDVWRSYRIAADVMVMVRAEAGPWRTKRILSALRQFAAFVVDREPRETGEIGESRDDGDKQVKSIKGIKNDKDDKENQGE